MLWPRAESEFETWSNLEHHDAAAGKSGRATVHAVDGRERRGVASGREEFSVDLGGRAWTQKPQKYRAKSLAALRQKYAELADKRAPDPILGRAGCTAALRS